MGLSGLAEKLTMRRFYSPLLSAHKAGETIPLQAEITRHLSTVLRQQQGCQFELFDGKGLIAKCTLDADPKLAQIDLLTEITPPAFRLELIQCLAKGEKLEMVLQKGTELGLSHFVLTPSERTIVKIDSSKKKSRIARWQKIIHEACRQCGQPFVPEVALSESFSSALAMAKEELKLMLWEDASVPLPQRLPPTPPASISLLVGPEGGFSAEEARHAEAAGFQTVKLGPRILRTETAGLAILSILQYVYGDFVVDEGGFSSITNGKEFS